MTIWPEEVPINLNNPLVPDPIREAVLKFYSEGDNLHRVETNDGIEWWLIGSDGNLIEGFWQE